MLDRLTAGQRSLEPRILVRIQVEQPRRSASCSLSENSTRPDGALLVSAWRSHVVRRRWSHQTISNFAGLVRWCTATAVNGRSAGPIPAPAAKASSALGAPVYQQWSGASSALVACADSTSVQRTLVAFACRGQHPGSALSLADGAIKLSAERRLDRWCGSGIFNPATTGSIPVGVTTITAGSGARAGNDRGRAVERRRALHSKLDW